MSFMTGMKSSWAALLGSLDMSLLISGDSIGSIDGLSASLTKTVSSAVKS